jgi:serine phosphatase RsbU (regulator of sigma subunit)
MASGAHAPTGDGIDLLLVEDDEGDARLVIDDLAERLPHARVSRCSGLEDALSAIDRSVDCVLLDLGLPDATGLDAVARFRSHAPSVPLIVLTGLDDEVTGLAAVEAGAQDYLVKGKVDGEQLARSIRYTLGRRQALETERALLIVHSQALEAARLEKGLTPSPLVHNTSTWVGTCYRAGRRRALLGGDFFDLVQTADDTVHAVIGDVCGRDPDEAAIGVNLRAAWRALILAGNRPATIVQALHEVIGHERRKAGLFATLCTLEIDPAQGSAQMIRAGHPLPVLIHGDSASCLAEPRECPGIGLYDAEWPSERVTLPDGWAILLYTDGIIEGRVGPGPERLGEEGLHRLLCEHIPARPDWRSEPRALLEDVIAGAEDLNGEPLNDDVAMLLIGARTPEAR